MGKHDCPTGTSPLTPLRKQLRSRQFAGVRFESQLSRVQDGHFEQVFLKIAILEPTDRAILTFTLKTVVASTDSERDFEIWCICSPFPMGMGLSIVGCILGPRQQERPGVAAH